MLGIVYHDFINGLMDCLLAESITRKVSLTICCIYIMEDNFIMTVSCEDQRYMNVIDK